MKIEFLKIYYMLIIIILLTGCSNITKQARLDRFNQKLESKEYQISKKLDEDLNKRDENLAQLKKDISMLKRNTSDMRKNYHKYLQQSFKRHSKNVKFEGMVQLISYEVEMLEILQQSVFFCSFTQFIFFIFLIK